MKGQPETRPVEAAGRSELDAAKSAPLSADDAEDVLYRISKFVEVSACLLFLGWLWKDNLRLLRGYRHWSDKTDLRAAI
jgi:hypothetical protein